MGVFGTPPNRNPIVDDEGGRREGACAFPHGNVGESAVIAAPPVALERPAGLGTPDDERGLGPGVTRRLTQALVLLQFVFNRVLTKDIRARGCEEESKRA